MTQPNTQSSAASDLSPEVQALKSKGVFKRLVNAAVYSARGLAAAWRHEAAFRTEVVVLAAMAVALCFMALPLPHKALILGMGLLTLVVEILNSAIEAVVDLASPDMHELAGRAKDMGSAAVMICMLATAAVWTYLLVGHFLIGSAS